MAKQWFAPVVASLLAVMALVQVASIRQETQTWDEPFEIASGYTYLKTGEYHISLEQPPLGRVLSAIPLLFLNISAPIHHESYAARNEIVYGHEFMYNNGVPADTILFWARVPTIVVTLALGLTLALWTRAVFGAAAALFALTLFSFDPNMIAYGRYAKDDMLLAFLSFAACVAWAAYLRSRTPGALWLSGALLGLAVGTKYSGVYLIVVFVILALLRAKRDFLKLAAPLALVCILGFCTTLLVFAGEWRQLRPAFQADRKADPSIRMLRDIVDGRTVAGRAMYWIANRIGLRAHPLFEGINDVTRHNLTGQQSYLLGMQGEKGWWYYFPVAFAVKTPVATLLILAAAVFFAMRTRASPPFAFWVAAVPMAVYLAMSMSAHINLGLRHALAPYPFLFALLGAAMAHWRAPYALAACGLLAAESLAVYPNYLAFFNPAVGGPSAGPRYLLDSNIDWGQDVRKLKSWMDARGVKQVCHCYFGSADLTYYGVTGPETPPTADKRGDVDCFAAISVTPLYGVYVAPGDYQWLRALTPVAKVGYSIYIYDLRKNESRANGLDITLKDGKKLFVGSSGNGSPDGTPEK